MLYSPLEACSVLCPNVRPELSPKHGPRVGDAREVQDVKRQRDGRHGQQQLQLGRIAKPGRFGGKHNKCGVERNCEPVGALAKGEPPGKVRLGEGRVHNSSFI